MDTKDRIIYFDSAATTCVMPEVKAEVQKMMEIYGNPSSLHTLGFEAERMLTDARAVIEKQLLGNAVFVSSGTEANNLAVLSGAEKNRRAGNRIITTDSEHPSVSACMTELEKRGFDIIRLSTISGEINMTEFENALSEPVCLMSVMHTNNETGARYPVSELSRALKRKYPRALVHSDCVQAFMKEKFTLASLGADMVSVSAHKIHALKGTGALVLKKGLSLPPCILGGGQEKGARSGTENTVGIAAFACAVKKLSSDTERLERVRAVSERLLTLLSDTDGVRLNLPRDKTPFIINFSVEGIRSETMLHALSAKGFFVSGGSACSSSIKISPVLLAFGLDSKRSEGAVRVSLSEYNTVEEAELFAQALREQIDRLRGKKK